ncbi:MAG: phosphotransferase [Flavobacteriaceae bacterium]|nr:phosphotransferase [Flavobacteriaceae bacterium]
MIQEVRKGEEINSEFLKKILFECGLLSNHKNKLKILQFNNGFSNLTYLIKFENKELVLRMPPKGAKFGHDMEREFRVLSSLKNSSLKIPKVYFFSKDISILGAPFYLMENINGIILTKNNPLSKNITSEQYQMISKMWIENIVQIHEINFKKMGLDKIGKPIGYVERQIKNWGTQYIKSETENIDESRKIINWLARNKPKKYDHCLIHNDYKYDNIVFDESLNSINAILDWEMCTIGDPLMDFGTSLAYWTIESDHKNIKAILDYPTLNPGNPSRMELVNMYESRRKVKIKDLIFYYVYGLFKVSVIVQQIFYRYKKGHTKDEKFKDLNLMTRLLFKLGWQAIQKNKIENYY